MDGSGKIKIKDFYSIKVTIEKINTWQEINIKEMRGNPCKSQRKRQEIQEEKIGKDYE